MSDPSTTPQQDSDLLSPAPETATTEDQKQTTTSTKSGPVTREIIETLLLAVLIFFAVRMVVLNFRVDGQSMDPSLHNDQMLLVNRNAYLEVDLDDWFSWLPFVEDDGEDGWRPFGGPDRGDIIVLNPPETERSDKPYIKRVIGLPGDHIEIRDDGVFINGTKLDEPYLDGATTPQVGNPENWDIIVPEDSVYVMGDNRDGSQDSRAFGPEPIDRIVGKAWFTYWPSDYWGLIPNESYPALKDQN